MSPKKQTETAITGSAWLPPCFDRPIRNYSFSIGDTIYDRELPNEECWGDSLTKINHFIQIIEANTGKCGRIVANVYRPNVANSGVKIIARIETTQSLFIDMLQKWSF